MKKETEYKDCLTPWPFSFTHSGYPSHASETYKNDNPPKACVDDSRPFIVTDQKVVTEESSKGSFRQLKTKVVTDDRGVFDAVFHFNDSDCGYQVEGRPLVPSIDLSSSVIKGMPMCHDRNIIVRSNITVRGTGCNLGVQYRPKMGGNDTAPKRSFFDIMGLLKAQCHEVSYVDHSDVSGEDSTQNPYANIDMSKVLMQNSHDNSESNAYYSLAEQLVSTTAKNSALIFSKSMLFTLLDESLSRTETMSKQNIDKITGFLNGMFIYWYTESPYEAGLLLVLSALSTELNSDELFSVNNVLQSGVNAATVAVSAINWQLSKYSRQLGFFVGSKVADYCFGTEEENKPEAKMP